MGGFEPFGRRSVENVRHPFRALPVHAVDSASLSREFSEIGKTESVLKRLQKRNPEY